MASKTYEMVYKLAAKLDKQYGQAFERAENIASKTAKNIKDVLVSAFAGIGIAAFIATSTSAFMDFENSMNEVFTLLPGITTQAMDDMTRQVKQASIDMGVLPEETVPALYQALSAGVPKDNVFDFLESANKAASGGVTTLETAVDGLSTVVNSYGSDVIDVNKASDLMFTAVKAGKTTFEELSSSLYNVLPSASASGVAFEDITAALATMTSQGVPTSAATNKISKSVEELSDRGSSVGKVFEKLSGKSFKDFIAGGGNMQDALQILEKHADKTNVGINELFGSTEAGQAALALTGNGTDKFTESLDAMANAAGSTEKAFNTMENGVADAIDDIKAKIAVLKISIGEIGGKMLLGAIGVFEKIGSTISKTLEDNGFKVSLLKVHFDRLKTGLSKLGGLISGDVGSGFDKISQIVIPKVIDVLIFLVKKAGEVVGFFRDNWDSISTTVSTVGGAIGDFVGSVGDLATTIFESLMPAFEGVGSSIFDYIPGAIDILVNLIGIAKNVVDFITNNWSVIGPIIAGVAGAFLAFKTITTVASTFVKVANTVKTVTTAVTGAIGFLTSPIGIAVVVIGALIAVGILLYKNWDTIKEKVKELGDKINSFVTGVIEKFPIVGSIIEVVATYISNQIENIKSIFKGVLDFVTGVFTGDWEKAWNGIVQVFSGIFGGIVEFVKLPLNTVITLVNSVIDNINGMNISIPDWVPVLGGKTFNLGIPNIPMFAKGTDNSPSTFIAGEKGAELVTNREHSKVFTALETGNIFAGFQTLQGALRKLPMFEKVLSWVDKYGNDDTDSDEADNSPMHIPLAKDDSNSKFELNYAPVIHINGGSDKEEILSLIQSILDKDKIELVALIRSVIKETENRKMRLSNG